MAIAITPDGKTAYVTNSDSHDVTPIDTATNTALTPISVPERPYGIAITPDGTSAYVVGVTGVTPIDLLTNTAGPPVPLGGSLQLTAGVTITPDGKTAYVADRQPFGTGLVTPIDIAANTAGGAISVDHPYWIAITPNQTPTAAFTAGSATLGQATSFDASASSDSDGTVAKYEWSFGDGQSASTSSPTTTHTYATAGAYTATLTVTDDAGCSITPIFTGQTMSCPGFASARTHRQVVLAPMNSLVPRITGVNAVGHVLSVSTGNWAGGTPGYGYQWTRDGVPIPGATTKSYTVQLADQGHSLTAVVTASVGGASTSASAAAVFIAIIRPASCPRPTGQLKGTTLGPIALGLTRTRARQVLPRFDRRSDHTDNFCFSGRLGDPRWLRLHQASGRTLRITARETQRQDHSRVDRQPRLRAARSAAGHPTRRRGTAAETRQGNPLRPKRLVHRPRWRQQRRAQSPPWSHLGSRDRKHAAHDRTRRTAATAAQLLNPTPMTGLNCRRAWSAAVPRPSRSGLSGYTRYKNVYMADGPVWVQSARQYRHLLPSSIGTSIVFGGRPSTTSTSMRRPASGPRSRTAVIVGPISASEVPIFAPCIISCGGALTALRPRQAAIEPWHMTAVPRR